MPGLAASPHDQHPGRDAEHQRQPEVQHDALGHDPDIEVHVPIRSRA